MDKKNPSSLYLEIGAYITPKEECEDYSNNIKQIDKISRQIVRNKINNGGVFNDNFIFVTEVADSRISYKKKSYMSFQIHLRKLKNDNSQFKSVVYGLNDEWNPIYEQIKETIESNGFKCFKTKN